MKALAILRARLREPSTIAGLSVLATLAGLPPGTVDLTTQVISGALGLAATLMPDPKPADKA